jgi:hypothetical protein
MVKENCVCGVILILCLVANILLVRADDGDGSPPASARSTELNILFTGRLLGYFRLPSLQSGNPDAKQLPCPTVPDADISDEGKQLVKAIDGYKYDSRVFVGTGDNFALYLPSRIFAPRPESPGQPGNGQYSKDQFRWDSHSFKWVENAKSFPQPMSDLRKGLAVVPTDNVGCFLAYAGYDAIVPGKEDFYFGAERLQALARFLASIPKNDGSSPYHPVQTLAANLLIKTSWLSDHDPIPDSKKPRLSCSTKVGTLLGEVKTTQCS